MTPISLPVLPARAKVPVTVALAGNPNAGKTTLFNRLTGLRGKTANFSGTTTSVRLGSFPLDGKSIQLLDLPGLYAMSEHKVEERMARDALLGKLPGRPRPQAAIVVVDATNLARNLYLTGQVRELGVPMVIALNMIDLAEADGLEIDRESLAVELGAPVVPVNSRSGRGIDQLKQELDYVLEAGPDAIPALPEGIAACGSCTTCPHEARYDWAEEVGTRAVRAKGTRLMSLRFTEAIDGWLTHPVFGLLFFVVIMAALFISIFSIAQYPMTWIEAGFGFAGNVMGRILPPGDVNSFVVNGLIGGIGGVLVFLPQICFLFFLITLLEDTGYLARAAFVADRPMSRVGLPGRAFVPMLSAHACAIPAIMSSRVIENRRDRLVAILVIPLLSCTARLPVYVMITALLFADRPVMGGLVFTGAYLLGMVAAIVMAFVFKGTILPGNSSPLVIELPRYRLPLLRNALSRRTSAAGPSSPGRAPPSWRSRSSCGCSPPIRSWTNRSSARSCRPRRSHRWRICVPRRLWPGAKRSPMRWRLRRMRCFHPTSSSTRSRAASVRLRSPCSPRSASTGRSTWASSRRSPPAK